MNKKRVFETELGKVLNRKAKFEKPIQLIDYTKRSKTKKKSHIEVAKFIENLHDSIFDEITNDQRYAYKKNPVIIEPIGEYEKNEQFSKKILGMRRGN